MKRRTITAAIAAYSHFAPSLYYCAKRDQIVFRGCKPALLQPFIYRDQNQDGFVTYWKGDTIVYRGPESYAPLSLYLKPGVTYTHQLTSYCGDEHYRVLDPQEREVLRIERG